MKKIIVLAAAAVIAVAQNVFAGEINTGKIDEVYKSMAAKNTEYEKPEAGSRIYQDTDTCLAERRYINFESGDIFEIYRYSFKKNNINGNTVTNGFLIPGDKIEIHYIDSKTDNWRKTTKTDKLPKQTLFIDTDRYHIIVGVPSVYKTGKGNTAVCSTQLESPITIEKEADKPYYRIKYTFDSSGDYNGSIWMLKSQKPLIDWNNFNQLNIISADLAVENRFLWDGYYFPQPSNYTPYLGEGSMFRHPSSYAAGVFAHYGSFPAAYDLGYAFNYICMKNQNEKGYWATGPRSGWLYTDFNIDGDFYDTRFNTDFAEGLMYAYDRYGNPEFLSALIDYSKYFITHAENNHYKTKNGGWLVQDYGYEGEHKDTHCSLNHQLAEMNLLYLIYELTGYEGYKNTADKMLLAVEDTCDQWILPDGNLKYALHYTGSANYMVDYPSLTYNDLFETRDLLQRLFNKKSDAVTKLMASKLKWMNENGITDYYK